MALPVTDAVLFIHGTGSTAYGALTANNTTNAAIGDTMFASANTQYSNLEIDFGSGSGGGPVGFPSYTEKLGGGNNTNVQIPASVVGFGGVDMGLHVVVGTPYSNNTITSAQISVVTSNTSNAVITGNGQPIASRTFTQAQLNIAGAHYYIPVSLPSVQEFLRSYGNMTATGNNTSTTPGALIQWFGPRTGGEQ